MTAAYDFRSVLDYLAKLGRHNNKAWFDKNRAAYQDARQTFESFVDDVIDELRGSDGLGGLSARECLFRINRDIRFSKDKSPYKTNLAATIAPGGRKSTRLGYHISLQPQGRSIIAGGLYQPDPGQLRQFRQAVDRDAAGLKKLTRARGFVELFGQLEGEKLKTAPKGYDRDHPEIELLQFKQVIVAHSFTDQAVLARDFPSQAIRVCRAMKPFLDYLNHAIA